MKKNKRMKNYSIIVCIILSMFFFRLSGEYKIDSSFQKANSLYQEGNYEEAAELYLAFEEKGLLSPELYFNAANSYFRSNKLGKARLYYERALLLDPKDSEIKKNLSFIESMLTDRFEEVPVFFIRNWLNSFFNLFHSNTWAVISLVSFGFFFISMMLYILAKEVKIRKSGFYSGISFLILSLFFFGISKRNARLIESPGTAIIMEGSQVTRSAPRQSGKDLFILHEGTKVWLENEVEDWMEIKLPDGRRGWIPAESIEKI